MAKILLVEDDNNLREIYEARLQAEGYIIVSAMDGEEALVKAKQEHPDLIISDVMMPRISGFEMLDILRNTEGLKDVKVIMLTALGQAEDKTRADSLGADRYLVKSQVTLEDIVKAADELIAPSPANTTQSITPGAVQAQVPEPVATTPQPYVAPPVMPMTTPPPATMPQPTAAPVPSVQQPAAATPPSIPVATPAAMVPAQAVPPQVATPASPSSVQQAATPPVSTIPVVAPSPASSPVAPVISMPSQPAGSGSSTPANPASSTPQGTPILDVIPVAAPATPVAPVSAAAPQNTQAAAPTPAVPAPTNEEKSINAASVASPDEQDDKLIADAVKDLTATLGDTKPPVETKPSAHIITPIPANSPANAFSAPEINNDDASTGPVRVTAPPMPVVTTEPEPTHEEPATETPASSVMPSAWNTPAQTPEVSTPPEAAATETKENAVPETPKVAVEPPEEPSVSASSTQPQDTPQIEQPAQAAEPAQAPSAQVEVEGTTSTADEQAAMQAQINDYIQQQVMPSDVVSPNETAVRPAEIISPQAQQQTPVFSPSAEETTPAQSAPPQYNSVTQPTEPFIKAGSAALTPPSNTAPQGQDAPSGGATDDEENVTIAHKKIIQPPVEPIVPQSNLQDLLDKEGGFGDNDSQGTPAPTLLDGSPMPPHQPGHVISPNGGGTPQQNGGSYNPADPNNIAL